MPCFRHHSAVGLIDRAADAGLVTRHHAPAMFSLWQTLEADGSAHLRDATLAPMPQPA